MTVIIADTGADTIKYGTSADSEPLLLPNYIARSMSQQRTFISLQLSSCRDFGQLVYKRPFEQGFLTNFETQKTIWDLMFSNDERIMDSLEDLLFSEPVYNLPQIQNAMDEIIFEEYKAKRFLRQPAPVLSFYGGNFSECKLIIDTGYSSTTVTPVYNGKPILEAVKRLVVGGKFLTNYLKELISFRHYNVMDEFFIVDQIKQAISFTSLDLIKDLKTVKTNKTLHIKYLLPDYSVRPQGLVVPIDKQEGDNEQSLILADERFAPTELLFRPDDIGIKNAGLPEMILQAIQASPEELAPCLWANIQVGGGNALIASFCQRLEQELRSLCPSHLLCRVFKQEDPRMHVFYGAQLFCRKDLFTKLAVTREEYQEVGINVFARK